MTAPGASSVSTGVLLTLLVTLRTPGRGCDCVFGLSWALPDAMSAFGVCDGRNVSVAELRAALFAVLVVELRLSLLGVVLTELRLSLLVVLVVELRLSLLALLVVELRLPLLAVLVNELRLSFTASAPFPCSTLVVRRWASSVVDILVDHWSC